MEYSNDHQQPQNPNNGMKMHPYYGYQPMPQPNNQGPGMGGYANPYGYQPGYYPQQQVQPQQPQPSQMPQQGQMPGQGGTTSGPPMSGISVGQQESYIENILRMNEGKVATVYQSFENASDWSTKVFKGTVEAAGKDHIILKEVNGKTRYLLLLIYVDYITFEGEMNYSYPAQYYSIGGGQQG